jgi:hypothetical protein
MYWRIRKITPDIVFKRYGVHAVLLCSLLFNVGLFTRVSTSKAAVTPTQKADYEKFVKQVTQHLFDASYLTVDGSMHELNTEILGPALAKLRQAEVVPKTEDDLRAITRQLSDSKAVSCIKFDSITMENPVERQVGQGKALMQPVDTRIQIVVHDAEGVRPSTIHMRYYLAYAPGAVQGQQRLVVYDFDQLPDQAP